MMFRRRRYRHVSPPRQMRHAVDATLFTMLSRFDDAAAYQPYIRRRRYAVTCLPRSACAIR